MSAILIVLLLLSHPVNLAHFFDVLGEHFHLGGNLLDFLHDILVEILPEMLIHLIIPIVAHAVGLLLQFGEDLPMFLIELSAIVFRIY